MGHDVVHVATEYAHSSHLIISFARCIGVCTTATRIHAIPIRSMMLLAQTLQYIFPSYDVLTPSLGFINHTLKFLNSLVGLGRCDSAHMPERDGVGHRPSNSVADKRIALK
jgi:hypothetical protein